jgi:hypothetical protein
MPSKTTLERARKDRRQGKAPSTQAGEFVREEMHHIRGGKHGARSTKQAIAIGLSKARRAGVKLPPPKARGVSERTRRGAEKDYRTGQRDGRHRVDPERSRAAKRALEREGRSAASPASLGKQAHAAASRRTAAERSASARRGARTRLAHQTHAERSRIARKAAKTRAGR